jgi:hypothetical protein
MNNLNAQQKSLLEDLSQVFPDLDEVDLFDACQKQHWDLPQVTINRGFASKNSTSKKRELCFEFHIMFLRSRNF